MNKFPKQQQRPQQIVKIVKITRGVLDKATLLALFDLLAQLFDFNRERIPPLPDDFHIGPLFADEIGRRFYQVNSPAQPGKLIPHGLDCTTLRATCWPAGAVKADPAWSVDVVDANTARLTGPQGGTFTGRIVLEGVLFPARPVML
jgi:hypothetical protein